MTRKIVVAGVLAMALAWCAAAPAALCPKCRDLMFVGGTGTCVVCGGTTASAALKLCPAVQRVAAPLRALPGGLGRRRQAAPRRRAEKRSRTGNASRGRPTGRKAVFRHFAPPATRPAAAPRQAQAHRSETRRARTCRAAGSTRWRSPIPARRSEGRSGWLLYDGQKLPRGHVNDYLPHALGAHLLGRRAADEMGPARLDAVSFAPGEPAGTPVGLPLPAPRPPSPWFEIGKADNGKRAHVPVGQWVLDPFAGQSHHRLPVAGGGSPRPVGAADGRAAIRRHAGQARRRGRRRDLLLQVPGPPARTDDDQADLRAAVAEGPAAAGHLPVHGGGVDAPPAPPQPDGLSPSAPPHA